MSLSKVYLTLRERLDFFPAIASIALAGFYAVLTGLWRTERQAKTWFLHLGYALLRKATARLSASQMQYILPPSHKVYERHAKTTGALPESVDLGNGALGHWIGDRNADNVIVWYHGMAPLLQVRRVNSRNSKSNMQANKHKGVGLPFQQIWATSNSTLNSSVIYAPPAKASLCSV